MITVITEHCALVTSKAQLAAALSSATGAQLHTASQEIVDAVNRALGDTRGALGTAIDALPLPTRWHAHRALAALDRDLIRLAGIDAILAVTATLPADLHVGYTTTRLRSERELTAASMTRHLLALAEALGAARIEIMPEAAT